MLSTVARVALLLACLTHVSHQARVRSSIQSHTEAKQSAAFIPGVSGPVGGRNSASLHPATPKRFGPLSVPTTISSGSAGSPRSEPVALTDKSPLDHHAPLTSMSSAGLSGKSDNAEQGDDEERGLGNLCRIGLVLMAQLPEASAESGESKLGSAIAGAARTAASLGSIIVIDILLRRLFLAQSIPFPSSLAGMLLLFCILCAAQVVRPKAASWLALWAAPGVGFISRWLALFFVPNLVVLPIVLQMSLSEVAKLFSLILLGLGASLPLAALTGANVLGSSASAEADTSTPSASPEPSAPPPAAPKKPWIPLLACIAGTGLAAILSQRALGSGVMTTVLSYGHLLTCTICGFLGGQKLVPKKAQKVLHPLITCTLVTQLAIVAFSTLTALPLYGVLRGYLVPGGSAWSAPGNLLLFMLGPATLSFSFQMFSRRQLMAKSAAAVSAVTAVSASFGLFSTALAGRLLGLEVPVRLAALPRQVTAPLAIAIAGMLRADPSLAATIVVITGLLAANFGQAILDAVGVQAPVARGLAMGAAGHGIGTAAMAEEKEAFPFAAIAMALNATLSTVLVSIPVVRRLLLRVAGV